MIIDCHTHINNYQDESQERTLENLERLQREMRRNRVDISLILTSYKNVPGRPSTRVVVEATRDLKDLYVVAGINFVDLSGVDMLVSEARRLEKLGGGLYFADIKSSVYQFISESNMVSKVGNSHFFDKKSQAITQIYRRLDKEICKKCNALVFDECNK